jgi:hypothetical protein
MDWFRLWHGTVGDPKLAAVARRADCPKVEVVGLWLALLEFASDRPVDERGRIDGFDPEQADAVLGLTQGRAADILAALRAKGLVAGGAIAKWAERQPASDNSYSRVKAYRERRQALGLKRDDGYTVHRGAIVARDGLGCVYCGSTRGLCLDHMIPTVRGGTDDPDNLAQACRSCNSGKAGRTPEEAGYQILAATAAAALARYRATMETVSKPTETVSSGDGNGFLSVSLSSSSLTPEEESEEKRREEREETVSNPDGNGFQSAPALRLERQPLGPVEPAAAAPRPPEDLALVKVGRDRLAARLETESLAQILDREHLFLHNRPIAGWQWAAAAIKAASLPSDQRSWGYFRGIARHMSAASAARLEAEAAAPAPAPPGPGDAPKPRPRPGEPVPYKPTRHDGPAVTEADIEAKRRWEQTIKFA